MNTIMAHAADNDESVTDGTVLTCEHCGDEVTIIGNKAAVEEAWNQEHAYCAGLSETKDIEQLNAELDPGDFASIFLNTNRPAWADPDEDRRNENAAFSQWNSEPTRDWSAPLETFSIIKASVSDTRKLAAALTFLADLAEGQVTV